MHYSEDIERSLLGGLIHDFSLFDQVAADLEPKHFYYPSHRLIYEKMLDMTKRNIQFDLIGLRHIIKDEDICELLDFLGHTYNTQEQAVAHGRLIKDLHGKRTLLEAIQNIEVMMDEDHDESFESNLEKANGIMNKALTTPAGKKRTKSYRDLLPQFMDKLEERMKSDGAITGVGTGFRDFDKHTCGLFPNDLIIVAARPGMGKTAFSLNMIENVAINMGDYAHVASLEMPGDQLIARSVATLCQINSKHLKNGDLDDDEMTRLQDNIEKIRDMKIEVTDDTGLTPAQLRAEALATKRKAEAEGVKLSMVMVDYIQLMEDPEAKGEGRTAEITSISRKLKKLAGELGCPVVALSQLNRKLEERPNKRPVNSDLRESGAIEQDADIIIFLYRDEYYFEDSEDKGIVELIISKFRTGEPATIKVGFKGQYSKMHDLPPASEIGKLRDHIDYKKHELELIEAAINENIMNNSDQGNWITEDEENGVNQPTPMIPQDDDDLPFD